LGTFENRKDADTEAFEDVKDFGDGRFCPFLKSCLTDLTRDYFVKVCNTTGYSNCHHFAKKIGELKTPIAWLLRIAVERDVVLQDNPK
jgi:hypothetical protein